MTATFSVSNNLKTLFLTFITLISGLTFTACDDNNASEKSVQFNKTLQAVGGRDYITSAKSISFFSQGTSFEQHERPEPVNDQVSVFSFQLDSSIDIEKIRQAWRITTSYPFISELSFTDIINNDQGEVMGGPNSFASALFGFPNDPMFPSKLATRKKTLLMSSPLALLRQIIEQGEIFSGAADHNFNIQYKGLSINLKTDSTTHLPVSASTVETDPLYGRVEYKVEFNDWKNISTGAGLYPEKIRHILNGKLLRTEALSNIAINNQTDESLFTVTTNTAIVDKSRETVGLQSSQFFMRMLAMAVPLEVSTASRLQSFFLDESQSVLVMSDGLYHSYAFKTGNSVVLYDAPQDDERSLEMLRLISLAYPGLPVSDVLLSHNHFDHAGGFRGAISSGAQLHVGRGSVDFINTLLSKNNNSPAQGTTNVSGIDISRTFGSGNETITAYMVQSIHSENDDMLIIYKPDIKTLFFADLYNAGFTQIQQATTGSGTDLIIKQRAQSLVNIVNELNLDVQFIAPTHGGITTELNGGFPADILYQSVLDAASF